MLALSRLDISPSQAIPQATLIRDLNPDARDRLFCLSATRDYQRRQPIFFEGDPCRYLFEVVHGVLKQYKMMPDGRRQITGFLYPGQLIGLATQDCYEFTAEAVTKATLCRYPMAKLDAVLDQLPGLARRLLESAADELIAAQDQMLLLGRKSGIERLTSFLLRLSRLNRQQGKDPELVYLPMTRTDIADYLGMTTETVSRLFTRLKTMGVIVLRRNKLVRLCDLDRLLDLSECERENFAL